MADTTQFELVSPERLLLSQAVSMVVIPGSEGLFGVLPRHSRLISALRLGVIDVYQDGTITEQIFVDGGFAEVTEDRCTVLAENATPVSDLDPAGLAQQIENLREELKDATADDDADRINGRIANLTVVHDAMQRVSGGSA